MQEPKRIIPYNSPLESPSFKVTQETILRAKIPAILRYCYAQILIFNTYHMTFIFKTYIFFYMQGQIFHNYIADIFISPAIGLRFTCTLNTDKNITTFRPGAFIKLIIIYI